MKKKDLKAAGMSGKNTSLPSNLTFDDKGKPINQHLINAEKLPNIIGSYPDIREDPYYGELGLKKQKTSKIKKKTSERIKETASTPVKDRKLGTDEDITRRSGITSGQTNRTKNDDSEAINLKKNQCMSDGNLNIRENMKAGPGIIFQEAHYVD